MAPLTRGVRATNQEGIMVTEYTWGYHSSEPQFVHVALVTGERRNDLFDVALYDRDYEDPDTGRNAEDQSLFDLRHLIGLANAAIQAGLDPLPVPDKS
jgi:hypothetical protein